MSRHYTFVGGTLGPWEVASMTPVRGVGLDPAARIEVVNARLQFITWFEYAPQHERDFDALLAELSASEEWTYVEREIDIRLVQVG